MSMYFGKRQQNSLKSPTVIKDPLTINLEIRGVRMGWQNPNNPDYVLFV